MDGKPHSAFALTMKGSETQGKENLGEVLGIMLESDIPTFIVELGKTVAESGLEFHAWLAEHEEDFRALAGKYI